MADLGPTATPRLELTRPEEPPDTPARQKKKKPGDSGRARNEKSAAPEMDFPKEDAHKLDERA